MKKKSWEATIIAVEKPVALRWYLRNPIEHLLNRLYCTFSCNITFKPFAFDVLFTTNNCSSRLVNDSNICHAVRSSEPPVFTNSVSIAHVPTLIVIAFFIENTTMDAVSRCISCGFRNRRKQLLETTRASFSSITVYNKDYVRTDSRQKHNSTKNPEISVLLVYNMKLFTAKVKRTKKLQPENRRKTS